jgi:hypothetical protein
VFTEDEDIKFIEIDTSRDAYLFEMQKRELKNESIRVYGKEVCYIDKKEYKGLVASHIVPLKLCLEEKDEDSAYDYQNTLLLQPNLDQHFDKFDFTIQTDGKPKFGDEFDKYTGAKNILEENNLDVSVLTKSRKKYLARHNEIYDKKRLRMMR